MEFQDKIFKCADCGLDFIFTAGEQLFFFHDKQFKSEPKRCQSCRAKRTRLDAKGRGVKSRFFRATELFSITFDSRLTLQQMKATLDALADHYRECGGLGFEISWELEDLRERKPGGIFADRLRA